MCSLLKSLTLGLGLMLGSQALAQDISHLEAEPQTPSGKFLTATEVKPILGATQSSWVAVREFQGQDLLYVTHLWSWRCGLAQMELSLNDGPYEIWPMPDCHAQDAAPGAILDGDGDPYRRFELGSVQSIGVRLVYDDLSTAEVHFDRAAVLMP
ncbi:hypothetical protein [Phaeobacter sp. HF9A]|uniref:hypothetical protein n=1 Tax=Phaeobacter sp. HF9A TaxID=2721561 RepID=UPI001430619D|nr:hypothetical protein [Phaeobacter sp. HF9A]NIZ12377.1 hypothetical protein [Phaeobacter sp. HF9A]